MQRSSTLAGVLGQTNWSGRQGHPAGGGDPASRCPVRLVFLRRTRGASLTHRDRGLRRAMRREEEHAALGEMLATHTRREGANKVSRAVRSRNASPRPSRRASRAVPRLSRMIVGRKVTPRHRRLLGTLRGSSERRPSDNRLSPSRSGRSVCFGPVLRGPLHPAQSDLATLASNNGRLVDHRELLSTT